MGEIADEIIEDAIDRMFDPTPTRRKRKQFQAGAGNYKWRTANGVIDMRTMTNEHLRNAHRVCERTGNNGKAKQIREVLRSRGLRP